MGVIKPRGINRIVGSTKVLDSVGILPALPTTVNEGGQLDLITAIKSDNVTPWDGSTSIDVYQDLFRILHRDGAVTQATRAGLWTMNKLRIAPQQIVEASQSAAFQTTSVTYVAASNGPDLSFVVPPSLRALVVLTANISNTAASFNAMSFEDYDTVASGVFAAASDVTALASNSIAETQMSASFLVVFQPEHAGATHTIRPRYRVTSGTGTFHRRRVAVIPSL